MGFSDFDEFVTDFNLKDGDGISARQIFIKRRETTPLKMDRIDGYEFFTFKNMTLIKNRSNAIF